MKSVWFMLLILSLLMGSGRPALALDFFCGTETSGVLTSTSGRMNCANGHSVEANADNGNMICTYIAQCLPSTEETRRLIISRASGKTLRQLSDDEINAILIGASTQARLTGQALIPGLQLMAAAVQCIAQVNDGCPGVNACANSSGPSSLMTRITSRGVGTTQGFQIDRNNRVPRRGDR